MRIVLAHLVTRFVPRVGRVLVASYNTVTADLRRPENDGRFQVREQVDRAQKAAPLTDPAGEALHL